MSRKFLSRKSMIESISGVALLWVLMLVIFSSALYLVSGIDRESIKDNVVKSLSVLHQEGDYYRYAFGEALLQKDNYTDALMIGCAYAQDTTRSRIDNAFTCPAIVADTTIVMTDEVWEIVTSDDSPQEHIMPYGRYWHGYLSTLRPLLTVTTIKGIRMLNCMLLFGLAITVIWLIWKRTGPAYSIFFTLALLFTGFPLVPFTMQFFTAYIISIAGCLYTLTISGRFLTLSRFGLAMFVIGGVTAYFDLLTTPLLTFGLPCLLVLVRRDRFPDWRFVLFWGFMWCLGYGGLWASKWILALSFTDVDVFEQVQSLVYLHSRPIATVRNEMKGSHILLLCCILVFVIAFVTYLLYVRSKGNKNLLVKYSSVSFIGWLPFIWILTFQEHSFIHFWYVWRTFAISIFAFLIFYRKTFPSSTQKC